MEENRKMLLSVAAALALSGGLMQHSFASGPDSVELESLAELYEPVTFDHAMHVDLTDGNCAECHHHTTGMAPSDENCGRCHQESGEEAAVVACRGCHAEKRFAAKYLAAIEADHMVYHVGKPGLKGAYHQNCLGCHVEMGAPAGCQDCHPRNEKGGEFFYAGKYAPKPGKKHAGNGH